MRLPESVREIADVIGDERALYLIGKLPKAMAKNGWNQVSLYVPKRLDFGHQLVRILGWTDANKLVRAFGGEILHPASCAHVYREFRDENMVRLVSEGVPCRMVAEWFGVNVRLVRLVTEHLREKPHEERKAANDNNMPIPNTPRRRANEQRKNAA